MTPYVKRLNKRLRLGRPVAFEGLSMIQTRVNDTDVRFCVNMKNDPIQRNHRRGHFYEMQELSEISGIFPDGGTFVDIGANVGNHSLFAALFFGAERLIPFEPNKLAIELLVANVLANGIRDKFDLSKLGVGVSDRRQNGFGMEKRDRNLGAAKMLEGRGKIEVFRGDDLLAEEKPAMIKIDVEGMEMSVLAGLSEVLKRCRPLLLVEVDNNNETAFMAWVKDNEYGVLKTYQRYRLNKNHLLVNAQDIEKHKGFGEKTNPKQNT